MWRGKGRASGGAVRGGSARSRQRRAGEQGRATGRGVTDRWGQGEAGPNVNGRGARES
jgi:hypothetical protein